MAAQDSGTAAASGPIDVPAIRRVSGTRATSSTMKGSERTVLTNQPRGAASQRLASDWPGDTRNSSTPSGPPSSTAAVRPMPSIVRVWPSAVHSSGNRPIHCSGMFALLLALLLVILLVGRTQCQQLAPQRRDGVRLVQPQLLGHRAAFDDGDAVAQGGQYVQLMADDDDGDVQAAVDVGQGLQDLARGFRVQRG